MYQVKARGAPCGARLWLFLRPAGRCCGDSWQQHTAPGGAARKDCLTDRKQKRLILIHFCTNFVKNVDF